MTWKGVLEKKFDQDAYWGGQADVTVEYINKELRKDVDKLVKILKGVPSNIFHDVKQDFQELLEKYSEYMKGE